MSTPAPAGLAQALAHPLIVRLADELEAREAIEAPEESDTRLAAVAAVLRVTDQPELLFIKRAEAVGDPWSGHMAFPGGRHEPGDRSLLETAWRETREEIAIDLHADGQLLGVLDDLAPRSPSLPRINIRPYVAIVQRDVEIVYSHEVADHFWVIEWGRTSRGDSRSASCDSCWGCSSCERVVGDGDQVIVIHDRKPRGHSARAHRHAVRRSPGNADASQVCTARIVHIERGGRAAERARVLHPQAAVGVHM
jgi:8-oxo-dGTP pyrophosphatase MutT (NUDIX family)